jgi:hypothetical protein
MFQLHQGDQCGCSKESGQKSCKTGNQTDKWDPKVKELYLQFYSERHGKSSEGSGKRNYVVLLRGSLSLQM